MRLNGVVFVLWSGIDMSLRKISGVALLTLFLASCEGPKETFPFPNPVGRVESLGERIKQAHKKGDYETASRLQIEENYQYELNHVDKDNTRESIDRKYQILKDMLEAELNEHAQNPEIAQGPFKGMRTDKVGKIYKAPRFTSTYHPDTLKEVKRVFKDFGNLYVNVTLDVKGDPAFVKYSATKQAWSGHWYPENDNTLYEGEDAALVLLDQVYAKKGIVTNIAGTEKGRHKGIRAEAWEGFCGARAIAAVVTPEPTQSLIVEGIEFEPRHLKGLMTYSHLQYPHDVYGIIYRGNADTDGTYDDLRPEAFQSAFEYSLGKKARSFVLDDTAGPQIWFKPLQEVRFKIEKDPECDYAFLVKAYALLVKERHGESNLPTNGTDISTKIYTYRLYVDLKDTKDGKYKVVAGQWLGNSFKDHPDFISYVHEKGTPLSINPEFNKNISQFQSLFMNFSSPSL
jgi:hypothetical protein